MSVLEKQTFQLGEDILIDVMPKSEFVNFRVGSEKGIMVKKVDLWALVFTIADPETQEKLLPVRQTEMVTYKRVHHVKLTKDVRAGHMLNVRCEINVPETVNEGLAGTLVKRREKGSILIPKV